MKIIILSFFITSQAQFFDEIFPSTINYFNLITNDFNDSLTTSSLDIIEDKWINVNQTKRGDSPNLFWRKINEDESTYILRSEGECINKMCKIKLKYNGSLSNKRDGCLSFILWTTGQPVGQLWIEEDQQQESFSQKIQLTNSSLRIEHSLRSKIKNLSINARILFRNSNYDRITLSNLNVNWKGSCPKYNSKVTSIQDQFTSEYYLTSEDYSLTSILLTTNQQIKSTTIKSLSSSINESNLGWILSLIVLFCLSIILSSIIYGFWTINGYYNLIWYVPFDYPIQFLARRSIRSSTRSENKIKTLSQISNELRQNNFDNFSTNSSRSTYSPFFSYF